MAEKSNILPNQKEGSSCNSNLLTEQEIESLRQDTKDAFRILEELSELEFQENLNKRKNKGKKNG